MVVVAGLLLIVNIIPIGELLLVPLENRFSVPSVDSKRIDGIIVLGGSEITPITLSRKQYALNEGGERLIYFVSFARRFPKARLVFSGGSGSLLNDEKELAEHLMLLDLGRNDVGRVAKVGTVNVSGKMTVEYYSHVMHIVSNVEGELKTNMDSVDALISGFAAGTVSGAPKIRAMEIIEELENVNRSFYGGAMGYFDSNGQMDTCISLRTGLLKDNNLYIQAGGGVVYDSDPEKEFQETINKAQAIIAAAHDSYKDLDL